MYNSDALDAYTQNHLGAESPEKLIQMLYEGILKFNTLAKRAINDKDIQKRIYWINRSCRIFGELILIIDLSQGDVAQYLHGLYSHQLQELSLANLQNSSSRLDQINAVVKGLNEAWKESANVA